LPWAVSITVVVLFFFIYDVVFFCHQQNSPNDDLLNCLMFEFSGNHAAVIVVTQQLARTSQKSIWILRCRQITSFDCCLTDAYIC